ncbi:phage head closure protein [Pelagerythrobacter marensis]|uniref:Phage head closure protein n=1 Tax=Pelagerythrobacter marensis TaxID=543877 RepID=A0ABZ2D4H0_9SPHN
MTPAGKRDRRIVIEQRAQDGEDAMGAPVENWVSFATPMARIFYGRGDERREAAREGASQAASFLVLATAKTRVVKPIGFRIIFDGSTWDITAAPPIGRREIEFTATRRAS